MSTRNKSTLFKRLPKWALAGFVVIFAAIGVYALALSQAAPKSKPGGGTTGTSAELYIADAPSSVRVGDTFTVSLRSKPPTAVDGIQASLAYNTSQIQFVSLDSSQSAFPVSLLERDDNGTVQIERGIFAPSTVQDDSLVSTVTFKALKSTRNSTLQASGKATSNGQYVTLTGGTLTLRIQ